MNFRALHHMLREWLSRLLGTFVRRRDDRDIEQELAFHIEETERELRRKGHSETEAYRLARVRAGNAETAIERIRDQSNLPWVGIFSLDVRLGMRMLRKYWGLTLIGGIAVAVALTLSAAIFAYFDTFWSTDLPLDDGDRVVAIQVWDPARSARRETPVADAERWRDELTTLENFGAFRSVQRTIGTEDDAPESVAVAEMTASGFALARTPAMLGRTLVADDERTGATAVVVIGYSEWRRRFSGDADILGRTLRLNGIDHTIVGVMPDGFGFPVNFRIWVPFHAERNEFLPPPPAGSAFGRLAPGVTIEQAQSEIERVGLLPATRSSDDTEPLRLSVLPYAQNFIDDIDPDELSGRAWNARLVILLMSLLLVPPSINIAILVYARTVARHGEIAVRTALGASRLRIVLQLFIEMLVLTGCAAVLALAGLALIARYLRGLLIDQLINLPFWIEPSVSWRTMLFVATLAVAAAVIAGLIPALRTTRQLLNPGLASLDGTRTARLGAFWTTLIVAQVAFSFAALPGAIQLAWGLLRADLLGPGFPAERYLSARVSIDDDTPALAPGDAAARGAAFARALRELTDRLVQESAVASQPTAASALPGTGPWQRAEPERASSAVNASSGDPIISPNTLARRVGIDTSYFGAFGARLLVGRSFSEADMAGASRAVIVNQRFVERTLEGADPVGMRIRYPAPDEAVGGAAAADWYEIVGVVSDVPANPYRGTVYHPFVPETAQTAAVVVPLSPGMPRFEDRLREIAATTNPPLRVSDVGTLAELYERQAFGNYVGGFGLVAGTLSVLLLSAAGTYALMSFTVNRRRREIGIRIALGAPNRLLLTSVFRRAMRQLTAGAIVGISIAWLVDAKIPIDSVGGIGIDGLLPGAAVFIVLVGLVATAGPARRALRMDPTETLRDGG